MNERTLVRASDIGTWAFCRRAWWLATVKQVPHRNPERLQQGIAAHRTHGKDVQRARDLMQAGKLFLALAMILAMILAGLMLLWNLFSNLL